MTNTIKNYIDNGSLAIRPIFSRDNFPLWKERMTLFLEGSDPNIPYYLENGPFIPTALVAAVPATGTTPAIDERRIVKTPDRWSEDDKKEVAIDAKAGAGSATLSMVYAAARFLESSLRAPDGDSDVYECAFVESEVTELPFFASRVKIGKKGVEAVIGSDLEGLTDYEKKGLEALKGELKGSIEKGVEFAQKEKVSQRKENQRKEEWKRTENNSRVQLNKSRLDRKNLKTSDARIDVTKINCNYHSMNENSIYSFLNHNSECYSLFLKLKSFFSKPQNHRSDRSKGFKAQNKKSSKPSVCNTETKISEKSGKTNLSKGKSPIDSKANVKEPTMRWVPKHL